MQFTRFAAYLFTALLLVATPTLVRCQQIKVGTNVQVSPWDGERTYDEVRIAADPNDPRYLVACAMPQHNGVAAFASEDGGAHWKQTLILPHGGDPECEFGNHGEAYLVAHHSAERVAGMKVYVFWSGDHGQTWEQRQVLPFGDRPSISVDRTDGQARDTLYILQSTDVRLDDDGGKRGEPMTSEVYSSRDGGRTFSGSSNLHYERKIRNGPYYLYRSHAAIAADGTATYISPLDCRSNNYGKDCFRKPGLLSYANRPGLSRQFELRSDTVLNPPAKAFAELAVDPSERFKGRLYGVYCGPIDAAGNQSAYLITSADRGKSWSKPLAVAAPHGPCEMPMVAVNKDGVVGISWYAGKTSRRFAAVRAHPDFRAMSPYAYSHDWDKRIDVRCDIDERFAASLDGGSSILPSVVVNPIADPKPIQFVPLVALDDRFDAQELSGGVRIGIGYSTTGNGDTQGLTVAPDGAFYPAWIDFRDGIGMVQTARIEVSPRAVAANRTETVTAASDPCRPPAESKKQPSTKIEVPKSIPPDDVTVAYRFSMLGWSYDKEHSTYTVDLQLEGPKTELSRGVDLLLTYGWWPADAAFVDADNGLQGQGARWRFTAAKSDAGDVRVKSEVRHIRVRMQPLRLNSDTLEAYFRVLKAPPKS